MADDYSKKMKRVRQIKKNIKHVVNYENTQVINQWDPKHIETKHPHSLIQEISSKPCMDAFNVQDNQASIIGPKSDLLKITKNKA